MQEELKAIASHYIRVESWGKENASCRRWPLNKGLVNRKREGDRKGVLGRQQREWSPSTFLMYSQVCFLGPNTKVFSNLNQLFVMLRNSYQHLGLRTLSNQLLISTTNRANFKLISWERTKPHMHHRSSAGHYFRAIIIADNCRTHHLWAERWAKYFTYVIYASHSELGSLIRSTYS